MLGTEDSAFWNHSVVETVRGRGVGCRCKPGSWESDRAKLDMWREGRRERSMWEAQGQDNNRAFPNSVAEGVLPTSDKAVLYHLGFSQRP